MFFLRSQLRKRYDMMRMVARQLILVQVILCTTHPRKLISITTPPAMQIILLDDLCSSLSHV